ncbi:response regulator, partial [Candidatus Dependentiae bacterium]|nr:response regulator [Candidatus Dependentiae bacterium]
TAENIEIITDKVLVSERDKTISTENLNMLMRLCHSIKGAARMLKLTSIAQTFHDLETVLKNVKENKLPYEKFVVDLLLEGMDTIKTALDEMKNDINICEFFEVDLFNQKLAIIANVEDGDSSSPLPESNEPADETQQEQSEPADVYLLNENQDDVQSQQTENIDLDSLIDLAASSAESLKTESADESVDEVYVAAPAPAKQEPIPASMMKEPQELFSYDNIDEDILADFISESTELIENLSNDFVEMESDNSPQIIDKIFRSMHTLKGGAGFVSLTKFQELAHTCEFILDDIRNSKYKMTSAIITEMLKSIDIFTLFLNLLNNRQPIEVSIGENLGRLKILKDNKGNIDSASVAAVVSKPQKIADKPVKPQVVQQAVKQQQVPAKPVQQSVPQPPKPAAAKPAAAKTASLKPTALQPKPAAAPAVSKMQISDKPAPVKEPVEIKDEKSRELESKLQNFEKEKTEEQSQPEKSSAKSGQKTGESTVTQQTLRVELSKLDNLMNLVGELVISKIGFSSQLDKISVYIDEIESNMHHINLHLDNADLKTSLDLYENFQRKMQAFMQKNKDMKELKEIRDLIKNSSLLFGEENIINKLYENWKTMVVEYQQISNYYLELYKSSTLLASKIGLLAKDLQENVMQTRMLPISTVFTKYKRTVRDMSQKVHKDIRLELYGEETEMDKNIIEKIGDPLTHIIRNSIDHGIESPSERLQSEKPKTGVIKLNAYNKGGNVYIEIEDDGKGIDGNRVCQKAVEKGLVSPERAEMMSDSEKLNLIFIPGFSTAEKVTEISGRGVGMDVVRENITKLKGIIDISTKVGKGTKLTIKLPLTLAILQVLQVKEENNIFAIPSNNIVEVFSIKLEELERVKNVYMLNNRGKYIPVFFMADVLGLNPVDVNLKKDSDVVVVGFGDNNIGLIVSEIVKKEEVVIKSLGDIVKKIKFISGATIEGDGTITLIVNIPEIIDFISANNLSSRSSSFQDSSMFSQIEKTGGSAAPSKHAAGAMKRVLVVEDSTTTRKMVRSIVESGGYEVVEGVDGIDGLEKLKNNGPFDLMTVDVNMPRLNGYGLTQEVRKMPELKKFPIIMITTRDLEVDKVKGYESGVDDYIVKPFEPSELLTVIKQYIKA